MLGLLFDLVVKSLDVLAQYEDPVPLYIKNTKNVMMNSCLMNVMAFSLALHAVQPQAVIALALWLLTYEVDVHASA